MYCYFQRSEIMAKRIFFLANEDLQYNTKKDFGGRGDKRKCLTFSDKTSLLILCGLKTQEK